MLTLDFSLLVVALVVGLASLGWRRGPRAEAVTLGAVGMAALLLGTTGTRERIIEATNQVARLFGSSPASAGTLLRTGEAKLVLTGGLLALALVGAHFAGSWLGRGVGPDRALQRLMGSILGGLSGFAAGLAFVGTSEAYLGRGASALRLALPTLQVRVPAEEHPWAQNAPLVFLGAFFLLALLAWAGSRNVKARDR